MQTGLALDPQFADDMIQSPSQLGFTEHGVRMTPIQNRLLDLITEAELRPSQVLAKLAQEYSNEDIQIALADLLNAGTIGMGKDRHLEKTVQSEAMSVG